MEPLLRTRVVLGFSRRDYSLLISRAQAVHDGISANPTLFAAPWVAMTVLATQLSDLRVAQQATIGHIGATTARNAKATIVVGTLETLETYVQTLCDAQPAQANVIIDAAAMKALTVPVQHKPALKASNGAATGTVRLVVNRTVVTGSTTKRTFLNWQYSLDGKTWTSVPSTLLAQTEITGLPALATVWFRASATPSKGEPTPWTQPVSLLVQ